MRVKSLILFLFTLGLISNLNAQAGGLDPTFDSDGIFRTNFSERKDFGNGIALQKDGKILVAGVSSNGKEGLTLYRFNPNGQPDLSFGDNGRIVFSNWLESMVGTSIAVQPDGKILLSGILVTPGPTHCFIARIEEDGTPDPTFGNGGRVITIAAIGLASDLVLDLALQADGKIIIAGSSQDTNFHTRYLLIRYLPNGDLDPSFGNQGIVRQRFPNYYIGGILALKIAPTGEIYAAGEIGDGQYYGGILMKFLPDGQLDPMFQDSGKVLVNDGGINELKLQKDGKILIGGRFIEGNNGSGYGLKRLLSNGENDDSFGINGSVNTSFDYPYPWLYDIQIQADGKILGIGGSAVATGNGFGVMLARYDKDGDLDPNFGNNGKVVTWFSDKSSVGIRASLIQPDGKLLIMNQSQEDTLWDVVLARYILDISWKDTFDIPPYPETTFKLYPNPTQGVAYLEYTLFEETMFSLDILDVLGRTVKTISNTSSRGIGKQREIIDMGVGLASGPYVVRVKRGAKVDYLRLLYIGL